MYFNVVTVSDITNPAGTHIDPHYWNGKDSALRSHTTNHKCLQERPADPKSWCLWRKALKLFTHPNKQLETPLGKWLHTPQQQRMAWPFYVNPTSNILY